MELPYSELFSSPIFTFLIAPEKVEYTIHSALVSHISRPLDRLMNIGMSESSNRTAWLKDIDKDTFARFCRFAYTGDYAEAAPDIILDEHTIGQEPVEEPPPAFEPEAEPEPAAAFWEPVPQPEPEPFEPEIQESTEPGTSWGGYKKSKKNKSARSCELKPKPWASFEDRQYDYAVPQLLSPSRANTEVCEDYTPVFLCHARLYAFGDKYDIVPLRELSLSKLHDCLRKFTIYEQRVGDVVELVRYTYRYTVGISDALRSLVIQYVAENVEHLAGVLEFDEFLQEEGAHAKDLVGLMVQRFVADTRT